MNHTDKGSRREITAEIPSKAPNREKIKHLLVSSQNCLWHIFPACNHLFLNKDGKRLNKIYVGKATKGKSSFMSNKSVMFFPGIVLSAGWTLMNIVKIINYRH